MLSFRAVRTGLGWLLAAASLLVAAGPARAQCAPVGSPYIEKTNFAPVERYLARAIAMNGLVEERLNASVAPGSLPSGDYRTGNWEQDIRLLPELNAAFIQDAASMWEHPEYFKTQPGPSAYLVAAKATVDRINAGYDCAGLRRPIIGAGVLENIDPGPGQPGTNSAVRQVPIPTAVIEEFKHEFSAADSAYYLNAAGQAKAALYFSFARIATPFAGWFTPDIRKVEGKLWVFHQAKAYLDVGFTSLHMGQPKAWAGLWENQDDAPTRLLKMQNLRDFMRHVRRYAARRAVPALLLTAEPLVDLGATDPVKFSVYENGIDSLVFDFEMATAHVREIGPGSVQQRTNTTASCPYADPPTNQLADCGPNQGTLDPCHGINYLPNGGGTTPLGKTYADKSPCIIWLDHGPTTFVVPSGVSGHGGTWGWDDAAWFTAGLPSADCRARWLTYEAARARSFVESKTFLLMPGILYNTGPLVKIYRLASEPTTIAAVKALWMVREPRLTVTPQPCEGELLDSLAPAVLALPRLLLQLSETDASSIYTWHIKGPNGYEPTAIGATHLFSPVVAGTYTITLRQDNLGLPAAGHTLFGSRFFQTSVAVTANCMASVVAMATQPSAAQSRLVAVPPAGRRVPSGRRTSLASRRYVGARSTSTVATHVVKRPISTATSLANPILNSCQPIPWQ